MGSNSDASEATKNSVSGPRAILPVEEAMRRIETDRRVLMNEVDRRSDESGEAITSQYRVAGGPLGDSCDSLRDLVAHVLMWDEINLAVLTEARLGRKHWSLDPQWETREAGQMLNASGVEAGRSLPVSLLLQRFAAVRDSLLAEFASYTEEAWLAPLSHNAGLDFSPGSLAEYVMTVPEAIPYWHAAIHLDRSAEVNTRQGRGAG
jgi:hypothetical protein